MGTDSSGRGLSRSVGTGVDVFERVVEVSLGTATEVVSSRGVGWIETIVVE